MENYTFTDKRGKEPELEVCRVCGAPIKKKGEHSLVYNKPTMNCIKFMREEISTLKENLDNLGVGS